MLTVARLAAISAATREESRGTHYRTDHPAESADWLVHTRLRPLFDGDRMAEVELTHSPVGRRASTV